MLIDKYGNKITRLLVDSGCFPLSQRNDGDNINFIFPSFLMLELNEFCGKYENGLPKVNPDFTSFLNLMLINRGSVIHPNEDAIFNAAKSLEAIHNFREKALIMAPQKLQKSDEFTRSIIGRLKSPNKSEKESLRFDALFYSMAMMLYIHEKEKGITGYLSNNPHDNNILINSTFWIWDGTEIGGKVIDPYSNVPPTFTWADYLRSKSEDVFFVPPKQIFYRKGTSHDVFIA